MNSFTAAIFKPEAGQEIADIDVRLLRNLKLSLFGERVFKLGKHVDDLDILEAMKAFGWRWIYKWPGFITSAVIEIITNTPKEITLSLNLWWDELEEDLRKETNSLGFKACIWLIWAIVKAVLLPIHLVTCALAFVGHSLNRFFDALFSSYHYGFGPGLMSFLSALAIAPTAFGIAAYFGAEFLLAMIVMGGAPIIVLLLASMIMQIKLSNTKTLFVESRERDVENKNVDKKYNNNKEIIHRPDYESDYKPEPPSMSKLNILYSTIDPSLMLRRAAANGDLLNLQTILNERSTLNNFDIDGVGLMYKMTALHYAVINGNIPGKNWEQYEQYEQCIAVLDSWGRP